MVGFSMAYQHVGDSPRASKPLFKHKVMQETGDDSGSIWTNIISNRRFQPQLKPLNLQVARNENLEIVLGLLISF